MKSQKYDTKYYFRVMDVGHTWALSDGIAHRPKGVQKHFYPGHNISYNKYFHPGHNISQGSAPAWPSCS